QFGTGVFAAATTNIGVGGPITATADTGGMPLPLAMAVCQTDPNTGMCVGQFAPSITVQIDNLATPTFTLFVQGGGTIPVGAVHNRVFLRFKTADGTTVGSTSAAVRTQ